MLASTADFCQNGSVGQKLFSIQLGAFILLGGQAVAAPPPATLPAKNSPPTLQETASPPTPGAPNAGAAPSSAAAVSTGPPSVSVITRAVGEVSDRVVTSREVRINDAIEEALSDWQQSPEGPRILSGQEKTFPAEVGRVLDEWVVYLEAKSLAPQTISKSDIGFNVKRVQEFWAGKALWHELEISPDEIRDIVERKLVAKAFEKLKNDPHLAPVSDDDALEYYRKNRLRFGTLPFSSFKDNIKAFLVKNQTERRLAEWREVLRRKYKVRNLIAG